MATRLPRILLALGALLLAVGGVMHTRGFPGAARAIDRASLPAFYAGSFKGLWLIDSASLLILAIVLGLLAARPSLATRWIVLLLASLPAATAAFIYRFVGPFPPAHLLLLTAVLVALAALAYPRGARPPVSPPSGRG